MNSAYSDYRDFGLGTSTFTNAEASIVPSHLVTAFTPFAFGSDITSATQSGTATDFSLMGEVHISLGAPVSPQGRKLKQQHLQDYPSFMPLRYLGTIAAQPIAPFSLGRQSRFELSSLMEKHSIQD